MNNYNYRRNCRKIKRINARIKYNDITQQALKFANDDCIVIFGVEPTYPETGYGYIKFNNNDVIEFVEKPNLQRASEFVNSKEYLWNSGMFVFKVSYFLKQMKELNLLKRLQKI